MLIKQHMCINFVDPGIRIPVFHFEATKKRAWALGPPNRPAALGVNPTCTPRTVAYPPFKKNAWCSAGARDRGSRGVIYRRMVVCCSKHMHKSGPLVVYCADFIKNIEAEFLCGKMGFVRIWSFDRPGASEMGKKWPNGRFQRPNGPQAAF
jgi:hypothetical protein